MITIKFVNFQEDYRLLLKQIFSFLLFFWKLDLKATGIIFNRET